MADPSTGKTISVSRTPAARILKVVTDIESIKDSGPLSPDTSTAVEKLLDKAREPSTDIDLLEVATGLLGKAQDRKAKSMELDELKFLFDIGDWTTAIIERVKIEEKEVARTQREDR